MLEVEAKDVKNVKETKGRMTVGQLVAAYIENEKQEIQRKIDSIVELIIFMYEDNSYLSEQKKSVAGKSSLPMTYAEIKNLYGEVRLDCLDKNNKQIELHDNSARADKGIINELRNFSDAEYDLLSDALSKEDLEMHKDKDRIFIYPECLAADAKKYIDSYYENCDK